MRFSHESESERRERQQQRRDEAIKHVSMTPGQVLTLQAATFPSLVKFRWRLRVKLWLERKLWPLYKSRAQKEMEEEFARDLDRMMLGPSVWYRWDEDAHDS